MSRALSISQPQVWLVLYGPFSAEICSKTKFSTHLGVIKGKTSVSCMFAARRSGKGWKRAADLDTGFAIFAAYCG